MKNSNKNYVIAFFLIKLLTCNSIKAYDEIHRYRPILFFGEAHIARDGLMALKLQADHGSASEAYNACGNKVAPGDIFGKLYRETIASIGSGNTATACTPFDQRLAFTELIVNWYQNLARGFFVTCYMPFRTIHLYNFPQETPYNPLQHHEFMQRGMGDFACSLGWACNYEDTKKIDFIDTSAQIGVALPTSKPTQGNDLFDDALGYEGRAAYFFILDSACGFLDWLTCGAHVQGLFFEQHRAHHVIFNASNEHISTCIQTHRDPAWVVGVYSKADHVILGFSVTLGYSFTHQGAQTWNVHNLASFQLPRLDPWSMHTIHLELDYDLATYSNPCAPSIGVAYNKAVAGKNVFDTSLWGGVAELTILFTF